VSAGDDGGAGSIGDGVGVGGAAEGGAFVASSAAVGTVAVTDAAMADDVAGDAADAGAGDSLDEPMYADRSRRLAEFARGRARAGSTRPAADQGDATTVGTAEALSASQPAASDGQLRSGRSLSARRI
jgi:hypothetical protein